MVASQERIMTEPQKKEEWVRFVDIIKEYPFMTRAELMSLVRRGLLTARKPARDYLILKSTWEDYWENSKVGPEADDDDDEGGEG